MKVAFAATAFVITMVFATRPLSSVSHAAQASTPPGSDDLSGLYSCTGTTAGGTEYRGAVEIVRHENTYQLLWMLPPREQHLGLGIVGVDHKNLAVSYFSELPGVVMYRIDTSNGTTRLIGQWTEPSADGEVFSEQLVRIGPGSGKLHFKIVPRPTEAAVGLPKRPA
jgi:hypothetical protein